MTTPDDGVREIHLSGKQLVFLFMAVTVASVVIFLCGVLVGRGVQARTAMIDAPVMGEAAPDADPPPAAGEPAAPVPSGPTSSADVTFPKRLTDAGTTPEKLVTPPKNPPPAAAAPAPAPAATPVPAPPAPTAAAPAATAARDAAGRRAAARRESSGASDARHPDRAAAAPATPSRWRRSTGGTKPSRW